MDCHITSKGKVVSLVVLRQEASEMERVAASRIQQDILEETGLKVQIVNEDFPGLSNYNLISLGDSFMGKLSGSRHYQNGSKGNIIDLGNEGYEIKAVDNPLSKNRKAVIISSNTDQGVLYGAYQFRDYWHKENNSIYLSENLHVRSKPYFPIRGVLSEILLRPYLSWVSLKLGDDPTGWFTKMLSNYWLTEFEDKVDYLTYLGINAIVFPLQLQFEDYLLYPSKEFPELINPIFMNDRPNLFRDLIAFAKSRNIKCFGYIDLGKLSTVMSKIYKFKIGKSVHGDVMCASDKKFRSLKKRVVSEILELYPDINGIAMEHETSLCTCEDCKGREEPWASLVNEINGSLKDKSKELVLFSMNWVRKHLKDDITYLLWCHRKVGYDGLNPDIIKSPRPINPVRCPGIIKEQEINTEYKRSDRLCYMPVVEQFKWEGAHLAFPKTIQGVSRVGLEMELDGMWSWGPLAGWYNVLPGIIAQGKFSWDPNCSEEDIWKTYRKTAVSRYGQDCVEDMERIFRLMAEVYVHDDINKETRGEEEDKDRGIIKTSLLELTNLIERVLQKEVKPEIRDEIGHTQEIVQGLVNRQI